MQFNTPPQPFAPSDENFGASGMDEWNQYNGEDELDQEDYDEYEGHRNEGRPAARVDDYRTEYIDEEEEGHAYFAEKRVIRETVDLDDAKVFTWGDGQFGKLGHQTTDSLYVPYSVSALQRNKIRMCALGKAHTLFLTNDGVIMASGSNGYGQLGIGQGHENRTTPMLIHGLHDIKSIAAGYYHSLALAANSGTLFSWGSGSWGKLGLGSDANCSTPRPIAALKSVPTKTMACGGHHSVAITVLGDVWTWGKGLRGQLGHNSVKEEYSPRLCAMLRKLGAERVRCGEDHTLVSLRNGKLYAFGYNFHGQLGLGDSIDRALPHVISFEGVFRDRVSDMACGPTFSMVLTDSGKVYVFGNATDSKSLYLCSRPSEFGALPRSDPIISITCTHNTMIAVADSGSLFRWFVKDAWSINETLEPFHAIKGVIRVFCGFSHFAAICTPDMGCTQAMITRDRVSSISNEITVSSMQKLPDEKAFMPHHVNPEMLDNISDKEMTMAVSKEGDGYVYSYGKGLNGRLGHGLVFTKSEESKICPTKVVALTQYSIVEIACGKDANAAITDTGALYTWGKNSSGKLGQGKDGGSVTKPVIVSSFHNVVVIQASVGRNHMACLSSERRLFTWGSNTFGQLGLLDVRESSNVPREILGMREANVKEVACGGWHTLVCTINGDVWSCGKGWHGQLGLGDYDSLTSVYKALPTFKRLSEGLGDFRIKNVYGGKEFSAALSVEGRVFTWGEGDECQLGHKDPSNRAHPKMVDNLSNYRIVALALGYSHMIALDENGIPYSWGKNSHGQLGLGEMVSETRMPLRIKLCRRPLDGIGSLSDGSTLTKDIIWGSLYYKPEVNKLTRSEQIQPGKVCMIAADHNYSLFVLERLANEEELELTKKAKEHDYNPEKKYYETTVIHELFGCGSGSGGVMQNAGKEDEYIPKLFPRKDDQGQFKFLQDVQKISGGKCHIGIIERNDAAQDLEGVELQKTRIRDKEYFQLAGIIKKEFNEEIFTTYEKMQEEKMKLEKEKEGQNIFALVKRMELKKRLQDIFRDEKDVEKWVATLMDNDIDLETLSTCKTDEELENCGVHVIGAKRRLIRAIEKFPKYYPPLFYSFQNRDFVYISWPPIQALENLDLDNAKPGRQGGGVEDSLKKFLMQMLMKKIFKCLARNAEKVHYNSVIERANARYSRDGDGTYRLFTWGNGLFGKLGHGSNIGFAIPTEVKQTRAKVVEIACGSEHTICRTFDGAVLTWGCGTYGQLGTTENYDGIGVNISHFPTVVNALKRHHVVNIAAGRFHNLILTSDRKVLTWGSGHFGQLGIDSNETKGLPVVIRALEDRIPCKVICGGWHSAVITEMGGILLWGKNNHGQLGMGNRRSTNHPKVNVRLRWEGKARTAALGRDHTLVVMVGGAVFSFGSAEKGRLGNVAIRDSEIFNLTPKSGDSKSTLVQIEYDPYLKSTDIESNTVPVEIKSLSKKAICEVAAGDEHSMALSVWGEVWTWGGSSFGQLGHGSIMDSDLPKLVEGNDFPPDIKSIFAGQSFSVAVTKNGDVWNWGQGEAGELGHQQKMLMYSPTFLKGLSNVAQVGCGYRHCAAVQFTRRATDLSGADKGMKMMSDRMSASQSAAGGANRSGTYTPTGSVKSGGHLRAEAIPDMKGYVLVWGEDTCGQLGLRGLQAARSPTLLQNMAALNVVSVSANADISAFVTADGRVHVCGEGEYGRLGLNNTTGSPVPTQIRGLDKWNIKIVACGLNHCLALASDQRVYAWGDGTWGNAGVSNSSPVMTPAELSSLGTLEITNIYAGGFHSAALTIEGDIYTWGRNTNGQLGLGIVSPSECSPAKVLNLGCKVKEAALGRNHTVLLAAVSMPNLFSAGMNTNGQLGLGDTKDRCDFRAIEELDDRQIISVACGNVHTAAVSQFGELITWGNGRKGQLGILAGMTSEPGLIRPNQVPAFCSGKVVKVVCGQEITVAINDSGEVFYMGYESTLGIGGNQAINSTSFAKEIEGLTGVTMLAIGSCHAIALMNSTAKLAAVKGP